MTINNFISRTQAGLYCIPGDFHLDPQRRVKTAVVSHAHGDHATPNSETIYCTSATQSFMEIRFAKKLHSTFEKVAYAKSFSINGVKVTFYPAGHMLGSAQILMEYNGERYLYTGDFKTQSDDSCEPFEFIHCDYLITETTFASPEYIHPDPHNVLKELMQHDGNVVVGAYAIGKAQRITAMMAKYFAHVPVYIHPDLIHFHRLYKEHGFDLGNWQVYTRNGFKQPGTAVYIMPPADFRRYTRNKEVLKVFATGWKRSYYQCDRVLPVSDHADWNGVLELIARSGAKKVFTVHGDGKFLKEHFQDSEVEVIGFH